MNDLLRQDYIGQIGGAMRYRSLVLDAFGVRAEAQKIIFDTSTVAFEPEGPFEGHPERRRRAFYWDNQTVIPRPQQAEGSLHEFAHAAHEKRLASHPDEAYTLAYQVAIYGFLPRHLALVLGCTQETMGFLRGYYNGIGDWPGMYQVDTGKPKVRVQDFMLRKAQANIAQVNVRELFAGCVSYTMGQYREGPRRLPNTMRWLFDWFFTGRVHATPYYLGGPA